MTVREAFDALYPVLCYAQHERKYRPLEITDKPYWLHYEKLVMWGKVNTLREEAGKEMVPFSEVERVEQLASGHFDYTKKFALHCAELVIQ